MEVVQLHRPNLGVCPVFCLDGLDLAIRHLGRCCLMLSASVGS
jgi:hypothetical protein